MNLQELLLTKDEIPIFQDKYFVVPIHPLLLTEKLDPRIAHHVFPLAAREWYTELQKAPATPEKREWYKKVFLGHEPHIEEKNGIQIMTPPSGGWLDHVTTADNGFATVLGVNRDQGMLMFMEGWMRSFDYICSPNVNISRPKLKAYAAPDPPAIQVEDLPGVNAFVYRRENIIEFPAALFLRNWAILYLNKALKSIEDKLG